ncbi:MAG: hypothetical protein JSS04_28120 [Proteobacteria bacterium]|nr:hypothetical protein [Pseudomonadota bacterium]
MTGWPLLAFAAIAMGAPAAALAADPPPVTVLRGSTTPPEPAPPPPAAPAVVERQTVIYLPSYSVSYWPPVIVNHAPLRHRLGPTAVPAVPNGWPLFGRDRR